MNKEIILEVAEWFINLSGIFGHYTFFTEKLWRKVPGFKNADEAEIIAAFLHRWFDSKYGFKTIALNTWFTVPHYEEIYNKYIEKYQPVFNAFAKWCEDQR